MGSPGNLGSPGKLGLPGKLESPGKLGLPGKFQREQVSSTNCFKVRGKTITGYTDGQPLNVGNAPQAKEKDHCLSE